MADKLVDRIKKVIKGKPKPSTLGTGMAANAANAAVDRNKLIAQAANPPEYKKGGKVKKTGLALVHKGEKVLTSAMQKKAGMKKRG